jgi:diacylglycerol kinase family enzyme
MSVLPENPGSYDVLPQDPQSLVILNPVSTHHARAEKEAKQLLELGYVEEHNVIHTSPKEQDTIDTVVWALRSAEKLPDVIVVLGGDGTVNSLGNFLSETENWRWSQIPLLAGGYGDANDGRSITFGSEKFGRSNRLSGQPVVPIYPLEINVLSPDADVERHIGLFYASLGFTALSAANINEQRTPNSLLEHLPGVHRLRDGLAIMRSWHQAEPFMVSDVSGKNIDKPRPLHEITYSNSQYMGTMKLYPGNPCEPGFESSEVFGKGAMITRVARMALGNANWQRTENNQHQAFSIITPGYDIPLQYDGETTLVQNGSVISVRSRPEPLYMVAPKLAESYYY